MSTAANMTRYAVSLEFTDGQHRVFATASSEAQAIHLAVLDARMASPAGSFFGALLKQSAVPAPK